MRTGGGDSTYHSVLDNADNFGVHDIVVHYLDQLGVMVRVPFSEKYKNSENISDIHFEAYINKKEKL